MRTFLILTVLWIIGLFVGPLIMRGLDPYGFGEVLSWLYVTGTYLFALFTAAAIKASRRLWNSKDDPFPGHRYDLVRRNQQPDWTKK